MIWPDQSKYEGTFLEGKMSGRGIRNYANGNIYDGEWEDDKPHGSGTFYKATDSTWKEGVWREGKLEKHWTVEGNKVRGQL